MKKQSEKNMIPFPEMSYSETGLNTAQQNRREPHQAFKNSPLLRSLIILQTARKMKKKNAEVVTDLYTDFFFFFHLLLLNISTYWIYFNEDMTLTVTSLEEEAEEKKNKNMYPMGM